MSDGLKSPDRGLAVKNAAGDRFAVSETELRRAIDQALIDSFRPIALGLGLLLIAMAPIDYAIRQTTHPLPIAAGDLAFAAWCLSMRSALGRGLVPLRMGHPLAAFTILFALCNFLITLHLTADAAMLVEAGMSIIAIGCFLLSTRLMLALTGLWVAGIAVVGIPVVGMKALEPYLISLFVSIVVSILVQVTRLRSLRRLETLRLQDERRKSALESALVAVERELQERTRAEVLRRETEDRYQRLFNLSPGAIIVVFRGCFHLGNRAALDLIGASCIEEVQGRNFLDFVHPEDHVLLTERRAQIEERNEPTPPKEIRLVRLDGSIVPVETMAVPIIHEGEPAIQAVMFDLTERKRVQSELEMMRFAIDHAGDAVFWIDREGRIVYVNEATCRYLNYSRGELLAMRACDIDPDLPAEGWEENWKFIRGRQALTVERVNQKRGGELIPVEETITFFGSEGREFIMVSVREIGRRKQAEMALRESEKLYRLLAENIQDIIWTTDLNLKFTYNSPSVLAARGYTAEEAMALRPDQTITPDSLRRSVELLTQQLAVERAGGGDPNRSWTLELESYRKDGSTFWTETRASFLRDEDGKPTGILGVTRDISERRKIEDALRESEELYRQLMDMSPIGIAVDVDDEVVFVNRMAAQLAGANSPEEIVGRSVWSFIHPEGKEEVLRRGALLSEQQGAVPPSEVRLMKVDGSPVDVEMSSVPVVYHGKRAILTVYQDIGERKRAREEHDRLEGRLRQSQKMEAIGTLAGGIAHDFNNILTGILGYANMLKLTSEPGEKTFKAADVIEKGAERASQLTRQLLGFARKGKNQNVPVDLPATVQEVVTLLQSTVNKNITITQRFPAGPARTEGDPGQIQQVILNLAINARDAMPNGGDLLFEVEIADLRLEDKGLHGDAAPGRYAIVTVSDTGSGIPVEVRDRVFEPFFTTKEQGKGTGMGLAMVYGIVKNHEGFVRFYTELDRGTTFQIYLPLCDDAEGVTSASDTPESLIHGMGRIFIVDDEEVVRSMATDMLRLLGYDVVTASDGQEAVEYYETHRDEIDLAIIDMVMPRLDGRGCFLALKEINPEIKAVLTTGYSRDGAAQEILDQGMRGFAQKPYRIQQLAEIVANALRG